MGLLAAVGELAQGSALAEAGHAVTPDLDAVVLLGQPALGVDRHRCAADATEHLRHRIPLGLDLVNRNLGDDLSQQVANALKTSIVFAHEHEDDALDYALAFGRGIDREDGRKFVRMYVNDDTVDLGEEGVQALGTLFNLAAARGIIDDVPELDIVQAQ